MNRLVIRALVAAALVPVVLTPGPGEAATSGDQPGACKPSPTVLKASAVPVSGLTTAQVQDATAIINAATVSKVPERGQTIAVMTALQASDLGNEGGGRVLFGQHNDQPGQSGQVDPTASAQNFYKELAQVKGWPNMPPTLAAHAAQHNLDPDLYARYWSQATRLVDSLTTGTGAAGLANLAARAQAVADCEAATVQGQFSVNAGTPYVGDIPGDVLATRAVDLAKNGGSGWHDRCQNFVAVLDGRPHSGFSTALDAWQTFEAHGVAHPVTGNDGVAPPVGAWLYYRDSTNPAGHVVTYLGNGQIASTDVFANGRVGVGPASAITDGPWHMQYLGWAAPWGRE
jgi:hypothetical protein